ncbi:MAG: phosphoglycerate kinase [Flavobacteriales bacterium]|nr:phosphoglycerate kinase [Flavobacteriales bacterium]
MKRSISEYNFEGKRALIRVDFNVPLNKETLEVTDDTRIRAALPTIKRVLEKGGSVILMSHMGRPKNIPEPQFSLKNIISKLEEHLGQEVLFATDCIGSKAFEQSAALKAGEVLLLENLRFHAQEKKGDVDFAEKLAKHGDVYVNDAFGTAHRAHASTTTIAQFFPEDKMFGFLIEKEIESVSQVLESDQKPLTAIVGGAKVSSKISILNRLIDKVDHLIIGGGMAYTFAKAQGGEIGSSLVEDDYLETAKEVLEQAKSKGVQILLPSDTISADEFSEEANTQECATSNIPSGWMGLDIGENAISDFRKCVAESKLILWNGPMGVFELEKFQNGTKQIALAVADATEGGAFSLIGGGDSVAAVNKFGLQDKVSHISTGGGAMLEYLEGKELPGIAAILH